MAEIMKFNFNAEVSQDYLNVSSSVGKGGVNDNGDVLVIQALFWEVLPRRYKVPYHELPLPTGTFDLKTASLIKKYQQLNRQGKVSRDGLINKAFWRNVHGSNRLWTIVRLNDDLAEICFLRGIDDNPISYLMDRFKQLNLFVMA
jgi:hypothetical protein